MIAAEKIVNDLNDKLKERNIQDAHLRQIIIIFVLQEKAITGNDVSKLLEKKDKNSFYDYMDNLHSSFYNCINRNDL